MVEAKGTVWENGYTGIAEIRKRRSVTLANAGGL
jgi:hypothetical protein